MQKHGAGVTFSARVVAANFVKRRCSSHILQRRSSVHPVKSGILLLLPASLFFAAFFFFSAERVARQLWRVWEVYRDKSHFGRPRKSGTTWRGAPNKTLLQSYKADIFTLRLDKLSALLASVTVTKRAPYIYFPYSKKNKHLPQRFVLQTETFDILT